MGALYRAAKWLRRFQWWIAGALAFAAGIATGEVRIDGAIAMLTAAFLAILAGRYRFLRIEYGAERASRKLSDQGCGCCALFWRQSVSLGFRIAAAPCHFCFWRSGPLVCIDRRNGWPVARWVGTLLLDAGRPRPRIANFQAMGMGVALALLSISLVADWPEAAWQRLPFVFAIAACGLWRLLTWGKLEARTKGLVSAERFVPWDSVKSYRWRSADQTRFHSIFRGRSFRGGGL